MTCFQVLINFHQWIVKNIPQTNHYIFVVINKLVIDSKEKELRINPTDDMFPSINQFPSVDCQEHPPN
jgi:hypothetical protein